jgi:hypothetical protein
VLAAVVSGFGVAMTEESLCAGSDTGFGVRQRGVRQLVGQGSSRSALMLGRISFDPVR